MHYFLLLLQILWSFWPHTKDSLPLNLCLACLSFPKLYGPILNWIFLFLHDFNSHLIGNHYKFILTRSMKECLAQNTVWTESPKIHLDLNVKGKRRIWYFSNSQYHLSTLFHFSLLEFKCHFTIPQRLYLCFIECFLYCPFLISLSPFVCPFLQFACDLRKPVHCPITRSISSDARGSSFQFHQPML